MSNTARVDSIDALKAFRVSLIKFAEEADAALAGAESEMQRMLGWLDREQLSFWQLQIRKRTEALGRAQEALRMKKLFPDASGRTPTPVEEEKAVRRCKAALEEAEQKLASVKKYSRVLQIEIMNYKGGVQRLATLLGSEVPVAISRLDRMAGLLEQYVALKVASSDSPMRQASASAFSDVGTQGPVSRPPAEAPPGPSDPHFPILIGDQVAVLHAADDGPTEKYRVFENAAAAREYAAQKKAENPKIDCVLFDAAGRRLDGVAAAGG